MFSISELTEFNSERAWLMEQWRCSVSHACHLHDDCDWWTVDENYPAMLTRLAAVCSDNDLVAIDGITRCCCYDWMSSV